MKQKKLDKKLKNATLKKKISKVKLLLEKGANPHRVFKKLEDNYEGGSANGIAFSQYFYEEPADSTMYDLFNEWDNYKTFNILTMKIKDMDQNQLDRQLVEATLKKDITRAKELIENGANNNCRFDEIEDEYEGGSANGIAHSQYFYAEDSDNTMFNLFEEWDKYKTFNILTMKIKDMNQNQLDRQLVEATLEKDITRAKELIENGANNRTKIEELEDQYEGGSSYGIACSQYFYDKPEDSTMFDFFKNIENQNKLKSKDMNEVLLTASEINNLEKVKYSLDNGANIEYCGDSDLTPLGQSVEMGNFEIAEYLVNLGANVNINNMGNETALMRAIICGNTNITRLLVDNGASLNEISNFGRDVMGLAAQRGNKEIIQILLDNNVSPTEEDDRGITPLEYAIKFENQETQDILNTIV